MNTLATEDDQGKNVIILLNWQADLVKKKHTGKTEIHNVFIALFFTGEISCQLSQVFVSCNRVEKDQVKSKLNIYKSLGCI